MTKIYTTNTCKRYTVSIRVYRDDQLRCDEDLSADLIAETAEQSGLHRIGTDCYVAMQSTVDEIIAYWQEQADTANSGEDAEQLHALPEGQEWSLDVDEEEYRPVTEEETIPTPADLEYIMQHSDQWIPEYCDELIRMADMEDEAEAEAQKDDPNYERIWYKAAEKLGIDIDCIY